MTLGGSAGRSEKNPSRAAARRRFTENERLENTPIRDDPNLWPDEPRGGLSPIQVAVVYGILCIGIAICVAGIILSEGTWEKIWLFLLGSHVALMINRADRSRK